MWNNMKQYCNKGKKSSIVPYLKIIYEENPPSSFWLTKIIIFIGKKNFLN